MNDKELLELAAKAAGISSDGLGGCYDMERGVVWNPLTDDGDALRLAVRLNLLVECMTGQSAARTFDSAHGGACDFPEEKLDGYKRDHAPDQYTATRRAIVRAAAAIGKETL